MAYRRTADTSCPDGPCPVMAVNDERATTALQGYDPLEDLDLAMGLQPSKESRIEMPSEVFLDLLAQHLTDADLERIAARRTELRTGV